MIDTLRSLGIEKGKPFSPDEQTIRVLNGSMAEARARAAGVQFRSKIVGRVVGRTPYLGSPPGVSGTKATLSEWPITLGVYHM
jgi:hypothetical protein